METQFYILLSLKTPQGYTNYGQYFFGNDREAAYALFAQLQGNGNGKDCLLHVDLMETIKRTPCKNKDDLLYAG